MTHRAIFLADGSSDAPLADHLAELCLERGVEVTVTPVDPGLLRGVARTVEARLRFFVDRGDHYDVVFVHRDAEAQPPARRRSEIADGAKAAGVEAPVVPIIPVRMTEGVASAVKRDFGRHRALLLRRLDRSGPVRQLTAWTQLGADIDEALQGLG